MTTPPRRHASRVMAALIGVLAALAWPLPAHAESIRDQQWHLGTLGIAKAHKISQGEGVTVAVIDTGIEATHPDLAGNILPGTDYLTPGGDGLNPQIDHGTAVAGLIAAHGHDGGGALGIAPKARVLSIRALTDGAISFTTPEVTEGIRYAVAHGAKVICIAFAGNESIELKAAVQEAIAADTIVVAGAGNLPNHSLVAAPALYPGVVAAAAVDRDGEHAAVSATGRQVLLSAPGEKVWSTGLNGRYRAGTGTSDSTAILAGVAALIRAKYPTLSATEVIHRMTATAIDKGDPGRDEVYGYGIVDPVAALTAEVPPASASPAPGTSPSASGVASGTPRAGGGSTSSAAWFGVGVLLAVGIAVVAVQAIRRRHG